MCRWFLSCFSQFCLLFWLHYNIEFCDNLENILLPAAATEAILRIKPVGKELSTRFYQAPFFIFLLAYCFRFSRRTSHKGWQNWEASHGHHQRQTPESVCVSQGWLWGLPFRLACFYYLPFFVPWELKRRTFLQCFSRRKVKHCNCKCFIFTDIIFEKIFKQVQN